MTETATQLLERLKYQIYRPAVTTMAQCSNGCGRPARGGEECWECLVKKLQDKLEELAAKRDFLTGGLVGNLRHTVCVLLYRHQEMHLIEDLCHFYDSLKD